MLKPHLCLCSLCETICQEIQHLSLLVRVCVSEHTHVCMRVCCYATTMVQVWRSEVNFYSALGPGD